MIEVRNLTKEFPPSWSWRRITHSTRTPAVDDVTFTCLPGRIFGLLGPNGAGKTTTLRIIEDVAEKPAEARRRIGFLTGTAGLYARLTPEEMIAYFARLYRIPTAEWKARMQSYFDLLQMNEFRNKRIGTLSTGMKQKVSIVRTMIHNPDIVVSDEATSGLDVVTAANIIELVRTCRNDHKTVIFSSHIMSEVDLLCDDLAIMDKGQLLFNGTMLTLPERTPKMKLRNTLG